MRDLRGYQAQIIEDSCNKSGTRVTTFELQMPKWLVAELNTHRSVPAVTRHLARNSASSRAVPTSRIINAVTENPVLPIDWRENTGGMQQDTILDDQAIERLDYYWLAARDAMIPYVTHMLELKADKQRVNRLLEPWMWTKVVVTSTEWEPFFDLRNHPAAQPEFGYIARMMHEQYLTHAPINKLWHTPYLDSMEYIDRETMEYLYTLRPAMEGVDLPTPIIGYLLISAARCGRVTYYRQGESRSLQEDIERGLSFAKNKHWSPLEHCGMLTTNNTWYGPFYEFKSLRKFFPDENGRGRRR